MSFGSNKSKQESKQESIQESFNQSYPELKERLSPLLGAISPSTQSLLGLLGLGDEGGPSSVAQSKGFRNFLDNSGYAVARDEGLRGITNNAALGGLLASGSTLKGATKFANDLTTQYLGDYMKQLSGLNQQGLSASQILGSAGQVSRGASQGTSSGSSKGFQFGI